MLKLLFSKIELGMDKILALGKIYKASSRRTVKLERIKAILN